MSDASLEDRLMIRELYGRYALAAAAKDLDEWFACWARDAVWSTPHFELKGRDAIRDQWGLIWQGFAAVAAFNELGEIRLSGDTAQVLDCVYEVVSLVGGGSLKMAGLYRDELVREEGRWRFARRVYELIHEETAPLA